MIVRVGVGVAPAEHCDAGSDVEVSQGKTGIEVVEILLAAVMLGKGLQNVGEDFPPVGDHNALVFEQRMAEVCWIVLER